MLAKTPPMGFNTWNTFGEDISDQVIRETADKMVELGLRDAGYEYLVIDDCWSKRERDPVTGKIVPDETKFPNGMKAVSDYVHSKGLKFGMYSCDGVMTCARYPASFDHEFLDAQTFAEYGVDFLKYDNCYRPRTVDQALLYRRMSAALKASGREILFSACNWGDVEVETWARSAGIHMYRSTGDINDSFASIRDIMLSQVEKINYTGPGCYNDMDMLVVGMYNNGNVACGGCTDVEYKTHFALWCMFSCPLMLGGDLRKLDGFCLDLVKNKTLIRIDQDEEGRPPFIPNDPGNKSTPTFVKVLSDNQYAVMFTNLTDDRRAGELYFETMGLPAASGYGLRMVDAFTGEDIGVKKEYMRLELEPHDCAVYLCTLEK